MTQPTNAISDSLGKALKWPIELENGSAKLVGDLDLLKQSIKIILKWYISTRFYLGEFGSKLEMLLEEPNTPTIRGQVDYELGQALTKWEPRITLVQTAVSVITRDTLRISITYKISGTNLIDNYLFDYNINNPNY